MLDLGVADKVIKLLFILICFVHKAALNSFLIQLFIDIYCSGDVHMTIIDYSHGDHDLCVVRRSVRPNIGIYSVVFCGECGRKILIQ